MNFPRFAPFCFHRKRLTLRPKRIASTGAVFNRSGKEIISMMMFPRSACFLLCALSLAFCAGSGMAQYILPYDTLDRDTAQTDSVIQTDTIDMGDVDFEAPDTAVDTGVVKPRRGETLPEPHAAQIKLADTWVRRLVFRGWLDTSHIGAFARYQLTSWSQAIGSYGPIDARVTVYYLGPTEWLGEDAEWLQVAVQTMEDEPILIEYDLIVSSKPKVDNIYRVLYRVDRGEVRAGNLTLPENIVDYDKIDEPTQEGLEDLEFYSGIFESEVFHGSGTNGADVYIYRADKMPPLGIVVLGYGDEGLTFTSSGTDAAPRFYVPPPPRR